MIDTTVKNVNLASCHSEPLMPRSRTSGAQAVLLLISVGMVFAVSLAYFIHNL